jgi:hypothetical protein
VFGRGGDSFLAGGSAVRWVSRLHLSLIMSGRSI